MCNVTKVRFLSVYVDDITMAGKKHAASSEVELSYPDVGCPRSKLQSHTIPLSQRKNLQTLNWLCMVSPFWICAIQSSKCYTHHQEATWPGETWYGKSVRHPKGRTKTKGLTTEESCYKETFYVTPNAKHPHFNDLSYKKRTMRQ